MLTKNEAYRFCQAAQDKASAFVANVVYCHHKNPAKKLRGMVQLLQTNHTVTTGADIDHLLIDGYRASWSVLEEWATRK